MTRHSSTTPRNEGPRVPIAYHEAGHYIAAFEYGRHREVEAITIRPDDDTLGRAHRDLDYLHADVDAGSLESQIVGLYAGWAAHLRLLPEDEDRAHGWAAEDDENAAEYIEWYQEHTEESVEEIGKRMRAKADALVEKHWSLIEALAEELLEYEYLDFMHCEAVIADAYGEEDAETFLAQERRRRRRASSGH